MCAPQVGFFITFVTFTINHVFFNSPSTCCRLLYHGVWIISPPFPQQSKEPLLLYYVTLKQILCLLLRFMYHVLIPPCHHPYCPRPPLRLGTELINGVARHLCLYCPHHWGVFPLPVRHPFFHHPLNPRSRISPCLDRGSAWNWYPTHWAGPATPNPTLPCAPPPALNGHATKHITL